MNVDLDYIIRIRRELHKVPEIGYDLKKTLNIVRHELDELGLPYTEQYGESSLVAFVEPSEYTKTIAIRADMDALPIKEETGLSFASQHEGQMHACGHECHVAMLLGTAKKLKEMGDALKCRVKLIFQAAEEGRGGASKMCNDGVMNDVDMIIGAHVLSHKTVGKVHINKACMNASSHGFSIRVKGRSCHVSKPQMGIDAIAVANRIYTDIQIMRAREIDPFKPIVIGIGAFNGGKATNIVCDEVTMLGTIRALEPEMDEFVYRRMEEICAAVAKDTGAACEVETISFTPCLINHADIATKVIESATKRFGKDCIVDKPCSMGAEDFSCYLLEKPGAMFTITTGSANGVVAPLHNGKFTVDESSLHFAPEIFIQFILDNME